MAHPHRHRAGPVSTARRIVTWTALGIGAVVVVLALLAAWVVTSESGTRWAVARTEAALGDTLAIGSTEGTIAGPLTLTNVRYRNRAIGVDVKIAHVTIDVVIADLLRRTAHVKDLAIDGSSVSLSEPTQPTPPAKASKAFSLEPPIDMVLDSLRIERARIERDDAPVLQLTRALFAGRWTSAVVAVDQLTVESPQGHVRFAGRLDPSPRGVGEGRGDFRWRMGERTVAGALNALAARGQITLAASLSAPVNTHLDVTLQRQKTVPWTLRLEVPRFDPRDELLPDARVSSLAVALTGSGTMERGAVSGDISVDDRAMHLDPLRFVRGERDVRVEGVLRPGDDGGELRLAADVQTASEPVAASADVQWHDVVIPALWTGQDLFTQGQLRFDGRGQTYAANGRLSLGPKDRIADIELDVEGSPDAVALKQFDVVQHRGRLAIAGEFGLKPALSWNVKAQATQFDPGAFAAAWRGQLNFGLASEGKMSEAGPRGTLVLNGLSGRLRGRDLSGQADLVLTPKPVVAGTLSLHSGGSDIEFRGKRGEAMDATLDLRVATLEDWLPHSGGTLHAAFALKGQWPDLAIQGGLRGSGLDVATLRADELAFNVDIVRPTNPSGFARADVRGLTVSGRTFSSLAASASGEPDAHEFSLDATGEPLAAHVALRGARRNGGWSGSLNRLVIEVKGVARLALRDPVKIEYAAPTFEMSRACLADGDAQLCARATLDAHDHLNAEYSIKTLPLALAKGLLPPESPLRISGVLEGEGKVLNTADGEWQGTVALRSPSGRIEQPLEGEPQSTETLLSYDRFEVAGSLGGREAQVSVSASVMEGGSLRGEVSLKGIGTTSTDLAGRVALSLPSLASIAAFTPQLANVRGRADANAQLGGTLQQPDITGGLRVADLATDIPAIGLQLRNGRIEVTPAPDGSLALTGGIDSGQGKLAFEGRATIGGEVDLNLKGDRFLAADMAGARVVVTPDLHFLRAEQRMSLRGDVRVPKAAINLQKLPRGQRAPKPSSDVVVVDEHTVEEKVSAVPLRADVTVIVGDEVELTGFGLQAKLDGRLRVLEAPGEPTLGSGQIRIQGTYKAYGQDLTVEQGQLLYASTPLDNPGLNITATRVIEDVTAGLRIAGTAQKPELTVFSDPVMSQANALSYLVAGKPLDQIGSGAGEGDAVQAAARSLGTAAGGLLAKNIGRRLGVSEVGVKDEEMIGGAALTVGQYLSPRLYLSYGVGLFEPGEVVTLRYKLKRDFSVQAQAGPEDTRAGVQYRIER